MIKLSDISASITSVLCLKVCILYHRIPNFYLGSTTTTVRSLHGQTKFEFADCIKGAYIKFIKGILYIYSKTFPPSFR